MKEKFMDNMYIEVPFSVFKVKGIVFFEKETLEPMYFDVMGVNNINQKEIPLEVLVLIEELLVRYYRQEISLLIREQQALNRA